MNSDRISRLLSGVIILGLIPLLVADSRIDLLDKILLLAACALLLLIASGKLADHPEKASDIRTEEVPLRRLAEIIEDAKPETQAAFRTWVDKLPEHMRKELQEQESRRP